MNMQKYKLLRGQEKSFLYYDSSMAIVSIDKKNGGVIDVHTNEQIESIIYANNEIQIKKNDTYNLRNIERITLCVSNDCNLRCKYCYAQGGSFGVKRDLMSLEVAKRFVSFCKDSFDSISSIVFFGGEPLLNIDVIEYVCESISQFYESKNVKTPDFCIVTNGTILNKSVLNLIRKYICRITVSIDGPKILHDSNRVYVNGTGSYEDVVKFIRQTKKIQNLQISYEATYTEDALKKGYNYVSLKNFFSDTLGISGIIVDECNLDKKLPIDYIQSITKEQIIESNFNCIPGGVWGILELLVNRKNNCFCNIGYKNFSVNTRGEIFACHLVNEKHKCSLGRIDGKNIFNTPQDFRATICDVNKECSACDECWCKNLCGGCTIECFYDKVSKSILKIPNSSFCNNRKMYIEQALILISSIRSDKLLWSLLLGKINRGDI